MANSTDNTSNPLLSTGLVSLLLAALAVVIPPLIPLESTRPLGNSAKFLFQDIEDVNARLWQDPFEAADRHDPDKKADGDSGCDSDADNNPMKPHHTIKALACSIKEHTRPVIIGVMVPGGPYAESAEQRRRIRYAVLSGLAVSGYAPEDSQHIGYLKTEEKLRLPDRVPFEWFNKLEQSNDHENAASPRKKKDDFHSKVNKQSVLLMWLDETAFSKKPVETVRVLKTYVDEELKPGGGNNSKYLFIGPNTSDTLLAMLKPASNIEMNGQEQSDSSISSNEFEFYTADATADDNALKTSGKKLIPKPFDNQTLPRILRTTLSDQALAAKIGEEMKLRGIDADCQSPNILYCNQLSKDSIVLISEWDTHYGRRGLPVAIMKTMSCDHYNCEPFGRDWLAPNWVHQFSYMRGLDGIVPDEPSKGSQESKPNKAIDKDKALKDAIERPEGQSQKDYLRRMAERIEKLNQELGEKGKGGKIRAIGVLGSDAYDKLLVLKALRPRFPGVIFFTTDLDTRLMHPEDLDATRNLLVASSFGLQLRPELQKNIPPFRDSRQTAFFLATQSALLNTEAALVGKKEVFDQKAIDNLLKPRIFELGLHGPVDLSPREINKYGAPSSGGGKTFKTFWNIYPQPADSWREWNLMGWGLIMGFLGFLSYVLASFLSDDLKQKPKNQFAFIEDTSQENPEKKGERGEESVWPELMWVLKVLALVWVCIIVWEMSLGDEGEPFAWADGISLWPGEIIRLIAGILGSYFIAKSINDLQQSKKPLEEEFLLPNCDNEVDYDAGSKEIANITKVWRGYCSNIQLENFRKQVLVSSVCLFLFSVALIFPFGFPDAPYRGSASRYADIVAWMFVVFVLLILVMIAMNATRYCVGLIDVIAQNPSHWPKTARTKFGVGSASTDQAWLYKRLKEHKIEHELQDSIDIPFIEELTQTVNHLAYYPFIVLTLMGLSRNRIFDNWNTPIGLLLVYILCIGLIVGSNVYLRSKAEEARDKVLNQLESMSLVLGSIASEEAKNFKQQIVDAIARIKATNRGAYTPLAQETAIHAALLPIGGWGGITLLQYLSMLVTA